jgi:hypothetical protein
MGTTPIFGFPYPDPSDLVANYPTTAQQLAEDVEDAIYARKVLQVVAATYATTTTSTSSTFADTGLTATITPSSASNKVLAIVQQSGVGKSSTDNYVQLRLVRTSTTLALFEQQAAITASSAVNNSGGSGIVYLDSPATTSATTYKTTFASGANTSAVQVNNNNAVSSIVLMEISA